MGIDSPTSRLKLKPALMNNVTCSSVPISRVGGAWNRGYEKLGVFILQAMKAESIHVRDNS